VEMACKAVALTRLACPAANLPSTTALATLHPREGRQLGLTRGANVVMPNLTPPQYRVLYEIYPNKACIGDMADGCYGCLHERIASIGRDVGVGSGESAAYRERQSAVAGDERGVSGGA